MAGGSNLRMVELACGANPAAFLADKCQHITAIDFSPVGLTAAATILKEANVPVETVEADITRLPIEDDAFDLAYSAQAIYHIDTPDGQAAAFDEALRIVKPGGRAIFVMVNPFPLLFPIRSLRRLLAMTPGVNSILNRIRTKPPIPYAPMPLGWMKKTLAKWGTVHITGYAISSVDFDRSLSEKGFIGLTVWRLIEWLETKHPDVAARLGCYVIITVDKFKLPPRHLENSDGSNG
jgi:ubiquinone/menaquinone biosynthesis C-methylase UbiE